MPKLRLRDADCRAAAKAAVPVELWDEATGGLCLRVFATGKATWTVRYRPRDGGSYQRLKLGTFPDVTLSEARERATRVRAKVFDGEDPASERRARRTAPTVADLCRRYLEEEADTKRKPRTAELYRSYLNRHVVPALGERKAYTIRPADVVALHREIGAAKPATANRVVDTLSAAFRYGGKIGLVPEGHNPTRGIEKFAEQGRERFLSTDELKRLGDTLRQAETEGLPWPEDAAPRSKHDRKPENRKTRLAPAVVAAFRLLLFTGCRLREILHLRWADVDAERGFINLPDSKTGRRAVVLNAPALAVLDGLDRLGDYAIPGDDPKKPRADLKKPWDLIRANAGLPDLRIHDLRHSFASVGAGGGLGLPIVGKLLGHRQASTTQKYAHLADDPVRRASDSIGHTIAAAMGDEVPAGEVVRFPRGRGR
jgi:integrase